MANSAEFIDHLMDMAAAFGPVQARRMFGGHGLFRDGIMIGLVADDTLYLKVDDRNRGDFEAAGTGPFIYDGKGKPMAMSYYEAPATAMEDPDRLTDWLRSAQGAALRAQANKPAKRRSAKSKMPPG